MADRYRRGDNRFIERLWGSLTFEGSRLRDYEDGRAQAEGLGRWFGRHNLHPPHQAFSHATHGDVYFFQGS